MVSLLNEMYKRLRTVRQAPFKTRKGKKYVKEKAESKVHETAEIQDWRQRRPDAETKKHKD